MVELTAPEAQSAPSFWPLLLYAGGMFWEVLKNSADLVAGDERRRMLFMGFLLCLAAVSFLELAGGSPLFERELRLNTFRGVVYLGLPYLAYTSLYAQKRYTPVERRHLVFLFGIGLLSAFVALALGTWLVMPLVWEGLLLATVWRSGRWDDPLDGLVYGLALGMGFVVFYTEPLILPFPALLGFSGALIRAMESFAQNVIWPWELRWWLILAGGAAAAAWLGYCTGRAHATHRGRRGSWLTLGLALSVAILAALSPYV